MTGDPADVRRRLLAWYDRGRRDLPWRVPPGSAGRPLDPYHVLVSEAMLQQTQVATVIPYFRRFLDRFPTAAALAAADEQAVLRAWQGLGYYSRARNLQAAARRIVAEHGGRVPDTVEGLLSLPGVGRYTAGAVASIAFGRRAPILDGNVARVAVPAGRRPDRPARAGHAGRAVGPGRGVLPAEADARFGDFNSALMELGATVCTPRSPRCLYCPVRDHCEAAAAGIQEQVPPPKPGKPTPLFRRWTFCIAGRPVPGRAAAGQGPVGRHVAVRHGRGRRRRADGGLLADRFGLTTTAPELLGRVEHGLTHRRYEFDVFRCASRATRRPSPRGGGRRRPTWPPCRCRGPQVRIVELLARPARPVRERSTRPRHRLPVQRRPGTAGASCAR